MKLLRRLVLWSGLLLITLALLLLLSGFVYEQMARARAVRDFPPPGKMVDIGGRRLQLDCRGSGKPVVVFESGLDMNGALAWAKVHDAVAKTTRACAYSRAGILWSDADTHAHSGKEIAADLHELLTRAGETGPYVMVAHSAGGPYVLHYTKYFGAEVAGMVLVDASHPEQIQRMKGVHPEDLEQITAPDWMDKFRLNFGYTRIKLSPGYRGFPNQAPETLPAIAAFRIQSAVPMYTELAELKHVLPEISDFKQLGERPLVVLTASEQMIPAEAFPSPEIAKRYETIWSRMQDEMAAWSSRSTHKLVPNAKHYIHFDQPQAVVDAVQAVVAMVRGK